MNPVEAILKAADETGEALLALKARNSKLESEYREVREELGLVKKREAHLIDDNNALREGWNNTYLELHRKTMVDPADATQVETLVNRLHVAKMTLGNVRKLLGEESKRREALAGQLADALSRVSHLQKENSGLQAEIDTLYGGDDQC